MFTKYLPIFLLTLFASFSFQESRKLTVDTIVDRCKVLEDELFQLAKIENVNAAIREETFKKCKLYVDHFLDFGKKSNNFDELLKAYTTLEEEYAAFYTDPEAVAKVRELYEEDLKELNAKEAKKTK
ncbi:uncharacterized protein LOC119673308 [Teleopsis dalmanni]|uniref:uncharacterized protein LOC119673308 n=1 Tax=Teleopsis dalmanni TaxID=139649 RepID=UPI0018CDC77D|nr:uncharacterized protein LOC119673308 [Teleopsis dalmanni]